MPIFLDPPPSFSGQARVWMGWIYDSTQLNFLSLTLFIYTVRIDLLRQNWFETSKEPAKCKGVFKTSVSESQTHDFQV